MEEDRSTKGFWIIFAMIFILVPLFMFSREAKRKRDKKAEEEVVSYEENAKELIPIEEDDIMAIPERENDALYASVSKFRMHMKSLSDYDDELAISIERQNWDDIGKYAMLLKSTSPLLFTGKRETELPREFIMLDTAFHFQSLAVAEASQSKEMVKMNIEYEKLQKTCDDCHERFKEKE
ncbi:MAG: hypothetical protein H8D23_27295 [Candidatus Brocadiales bacterium]|nr:hypothetical protein [Candidatus Brocadiales bacterium]